MSGHLSPAILFADNEHDGRNVMTKPKPTRTLRTPAERATAALGVEQRRVEKLTEKRDKLHAEWNGVVDELASAEARRNYLAANPDLPEADTDPIPGIDEGES